MSVVPYWKERLEDRRPVRDLAYWREEYDWKPRLDVPGDTWPRLVACQAIWKDYLAWFEDVYLAPFRESDFFRDFPDQMPAPATEVEFWHTMSPLLYISGNPKMQKRGYFVWGQRTHEGEWVKVKVHRNFIRLGSWDEHVAAYVLATGGYTGSWAKDPAAYIDTVGGAIRRMRAANEANRNRLPKAMRKTEEG